MRQPPHRLVGHLLVLGAVGVLGVAAPAGQRFVPTSAGTSDAAPPIAAEVAPPVPADVERVVASDMVVDWVGGAPEGAEEALLASAAPADHLSPEHDDAGAHVEDREGVEHAAAIGPGHDGEEHHAAAGGGYALFSDTARWLPTGYTLRLTGGDARIEQYRDELEAAARAAALATRVPLEVAPAFGGPVDPRRGEIVVVIGSGPCGGGAVGCGGPTLTAHEVLSGRVWVHPTGLDLSPALRANLAAHEVGHALGLQHFEGSWTDGRQLMFPRLTEVTSFRTGDAAGLRFLAGASDRRAGSVTSRTYAAGRAHVTGTITTGSRVRISAGSATLDVTASGGRFAGALPLPAGSHAVCASVLDAGPGFHRDLGCAALEAPGQPIGRLGRVEGSFETIRIRGWAIDPQTAGPVQVQVLRNGAVVATVPADRPRSDLGPLAHHYGAAHGIDAEVPADAGRNRVCARVLGVGGGGDLSLGCVEIVHAVDPVGVLDVLRADGLGVRVEGWALDPNTPDPASVGVHVDGEPVPVGGTTEASRERADVGQRHPAHGPDRGFSHWVPLTQGRHTVCAIAQNVGLGQDVTLGCGEVVVDGAPAATAAAVAGALTVTVRDVLAVP